ncbi:MAG: DEAD/DEAH box helicase [Thiolinea sp.]
MSFTDLGLQESLTANIATAGYEKPTELQQQLIPLMAQRKSALVWTQSAAGKTGAFLIPAIDYVLNNPVEEHQGARVLILTSRRDRVNQITYTVKRLLSDDQPIRTGFIVSGRPYQPQMRLLRRPLDLMIATPGRLNDLVDNNKADFSNIELLIIDDLTAIYKKGLAELINKIVAQKPEITPVVAFVRHDIEVTPYAQNLLPGAHEITIEDEKSQMLQLPQIAHLADDFTHKLALTDYLLDSLKDKSALIFTNTTKTAKALADSLANHGHTADSTHLLAEEERTLDACPILIVPDQDEFIPETDGHVPIIHFEIPDKVETYQSRLQYVLGTETALSRLFCLPAAVIVII